MELGTSIPTYSTGANLVPGDTIRDWARQAEEAGFAGLWTIDHLLEPRTYQTGTIDPVIALSHAAAVTDQIELGSSIVVAPLRRTANIVRRWRGLQHLADRPVTLGVGAGYIEAEFEAAGVPRTERGPRLTEQIEVLERWFTGEPVSFDGRFHSFEDIRIDPVLEDRPRMIVGGGWLQDEDGDPSIPEPVLDRILQADGWIAANTQPAEVAKAWEIIADYARDQGVEPESIDRLLVNYTHLVDSQDPETVRAEQQRVFADLWPPSVRSFEDYVSESAVVGTIDEIQSMLAEYADVGFDQVILAPAAHEPAALSEQLELLTDRILPAVR